MNNSGYFWFLTAGLQLFSADERPENRKLKKWFGNFRHSVPNGGKEDYLWR